MGSKDHSFDIVSEIDEQELDNAVQQTKKEIETRFDFKGSTSTVELDKIEKTITLKTENEFRLKTITEMFKGRCIKRNVSLKSLNFGKVETGMVGGSVKQVVKIQQGIPQDKAKEVIKAIKDSKIKVQAQIQSDQVRVQSPKIDELQATMAFLRGQSFDVDLQFRNLR